MGLCLLECEATDREFLVETCLVRLSLDQMIIQDKPEEHTYSNSFFHMQQSESSPQPQEEFNYSCSNH
ncbi:Uncharacterised protein [Legionella sainthelensi]|nr:Uncharacterised protein [Legionella sainthelensi]